MIYIKVQRQNTLAGGLIERASSKLDEIEAKTVHKDKEDDMLEEREVRY